MTSAMQRSSGRHQYSVLMSRLSIEIYPHQVEKSAKAMDLYTAARHNHDPYSVLPTYQIPVPFIGHPNSWSSDQPSKLHAYQPTTPEATRPGGREGARTRQMGSGRPTSSGRHHSLIYSVDIGCWDHRSDKGRPHFWTFERTSPPASAQLPSFPPSCRDLPAHLLDRMGSGQSIEQRIETFAKKNDHFGLQVRPPSARS